MFIGKIIYWFSIIGSGLAIVNVFMGFPAVVLAWKTEDQSFFLKLLLWIFSVVYLFVFVNNRM